MDREEAVEVFPPDVLFGGVCPAGPSSELEYRPCGLPGPALSTGAMLTLLVLAWLWRSAEAALAAWWLPGARIRGYNRGWRRNPLALATIGERSPRRSDSTKATTAVQLYIAVTGSELRESPGRAAYRYQAFCICAGAGAGAGRPGAPCLELPAISLLAHSWDASVRNP